MYQELNQDVTWAKEQVELAKDNVMNWKPTYAEYEDEVCEIIDHEYPSVLGFKASDILKRMDWSQYDFHGTACSIGAWWKTGIPG